MLFRERYQVHGDLIHIYVQISLKAHRTSHVIDHICHDGILLFEMVLLFLLIASLHYRSSRLNLVLDRLIPPESTFSLLDLVVLLVYARYDVKKSLVIDRQDTVCAIDKAIQS